MNNDQGIRKLIQKDYILVMIENKEDKEVLAKWDVHPNGYPYLVILDASGTKLQEQQTGVFERDGRHDPNKLRSFLRKWRSE